MGLRHARGRNESRGEVDANSGVDIDVDELGFGLAADPANPWRSTVSGAYPTPEDPSDEIDTRAPWRKLTLW